MAALVSGLRAKVRIAVIIRADGNWAAMGIKGADDKFLTEEVGHSLDAYQGPESIVWVEAEVPLPMIATIQGEVKT